MPEEQGYNAETVIVGRALQKDFEQRGVHLDSHGQQQALQMSEDIATLGMAISKHDTVEVQPRGLDTCSA